MRDKKREYLVTQFFSVQQTIHANNAREAGLETKKRFFQEIEKMNIKAHVGEIKIEDVTLY